MPDSVLRRHKVHFGSSSKGLELLRAHPPACLPQIGFQGRRQFVVHTRPCIKRAILGNAPSVELFTVGFSPFSEATWRMRHLAYNRQDTRSRSSSDADRRGGGFWSAGASYHADPGRNERVLFFLSLGLLALAALMLIAVASYSVT